MKVKKLIGMTALTVLMAQAGLVSAAISPAEVDSIVASDYESQGLTLNRADIAMLEVSGSPAAASALTPELKHILDFVSADYESDPVGQSLERADIASMEVTSRSAGRATDPAIEAIMERFSADY